jgi:hypothetical protein
MPVLAKVTKQPQEVESYSVVYDDDLNENEDLQSSFHSLVNSNNFVGRVVSTISLSLSLADDKHLFVMSGGTTLTVPSGLGLTEFYVCNASQAGSVTIGAVALIDGAATKVLGTHDSAVLVFANGTWTTDASATSTIAITDEQRVRLFVTGGTDGNAYKAEITTATNEGRTLQDELIIKVKES